LQLALDKTLEATGVESGGILLLDPSGDKLVLETYWGGSPELTRTVSEAQADEGLMPRMLESVLVVNDFSELTRDRRVAIEKEGLQVMASAPLKSKDATLGVMVITSHSPHTFSSQDLGLLSAIGNQVGLAIERARLYEREQKRAVQLAVVNQVARRAASILDMDRLLPEVVAAVQQGFQYHNVALSLLDEAAGELDMLAIAGGFEDLVSSDYRQSVGEGMVGWVAETGQTLLANDVSQEPRYILGFLEEPLAQSELCVPLKLAGKVIGVLDIQCIQLNAFDETDLLAMETLAEQIVMAIENARLFEETKRRIKELTALYQNSLEITTQLEVSELLKSILERAVTLLKAEGGGICVYDPEREELRLAIGYGHTEEYVGITVKPGEGMAGKVFQIGEPLIVDDYRTWECKAPICEDDPPSIAVLQAPLKWQDRIMGVLSISAGAQRGPFDQDDVWLATLFANQVAVAIENARLYQQTDEKLQTRVRELAALYAIAEVVNHSDLDAVLQLALNSAIRLTGMDSGGILLLDPSTNELFLRANRGWSPEFIQAVRHTKANEGLMPRLLESTLVIDDLSELTKERRIAVEKESFQSLVSIPLKAKESALGVMGVTSYSPRTVASEELDLLATIGNQVGMAVDRANLQTQELRAAVLEERQDMARQMHDDIAQTLGYLGLQVDNVMDSPSLAQSAKVQAELEEIRRAIEGAYERVRSSITRLREDVPDYLDLGIALPKIINKFEKRTGCKVELRVDEGQLSCLSPLVALQATYIIREALANIRKHSGADSVYLAIRGLEDGLTEVTIRDNGRGFDLDSERRSGSGGYGLRFMRERAERVRGSLKVESQPGQGTRLVARLPPR
jgi:nitrate/nitrite-specific signal transduction histidine kinase